VNRRLTSCAALLAVAALSAVPAQAATKKKPKPIKGTYHLTTNPNPTVEVTGFVNEGCDQTVPGGADNHPFTIPAAGTLTVVLEGADPTGGGAPAGPDWDLFILDSDGSILDESGTAGSREETTDRFKKKQTVTIQACNLMGIPDATVSYTFTYA
jgi:hypothetical protein